jgi:hypothetical protein
VKLKKNTDFLGRTRWLVASEPLKKRSWASPWTIPHRAARPRDDPRNGEPVGYLTSGGYGYTLGKNIGYGYVRNPDGVSDDYLSSGSYELVVAAEKTPATFTSGRWSTRPWTRSRPEVSQCHSALIVMSRSHHRRRRHRHLHRLSSRPRRGEATSCWSKRRMLTHGCTWHAAGLVGQLRGKRNLTRLMQNSVAVFDRLEEETGQAHRLEEGRLAQACRQSGPLERDPPFDDPGEELRCRCHSLSADEAASRFPYIVKDGIEGAAFIPGDGYIDPYSLTMAYAKGARMNGVKIEEGVTVEEIAVENRPRCRRRDQCGQHLLRHPRQLRRPLGQTGGPRWPACRSLRVSSSISISSPKRS